MSTAKSMATSYLSGKRSALSNNKLKSGTLQPTSQAGHRFKSSASNLSPSSRLAAPSPTVSAITSSLINGNKSARLRATSMTNLVAGADHHRANQQESGHNQIHRPASRNALDSIHNGMNAKYAQVQSKVYLQNIRPQAGGHSPSSSKIPASSKIGLGSDGATLGRGRQAAGGRLTPTVTGSSDRAQLLNKLKSLQEELERAEEERQEARQELEREKSDKAQQIQQAKLELQEKLAEHDRQNEEYHQKLLEAYELADQNRRTADSALSESRQRDEEARKKVEELEGQLAELKEFVAMKEEMTGKMYELREQLRQERERYEEQLKSLHQLFENEKISGRKLDQNSNYFNRIKPTLLQSNESINGQFAPDDSNNKCRHCMRRSEHDIYGSKLSTRMQDTAKSAWKTSKRFASSVITGGVSLSACRQCTNGSGAKRTGAAVAAADSPSPRNLLKQRDLSPVPPPAETAMTTADEHTSVIRVESAANKLEPGTSSERTASSHQEPLPPSSMIVRMDEDNKLTIVTKFNDLAVDQHSAGPQSSGAGSSAELGGAGSSSNGSERSRCESSSSGRGTSSDAGSAASQNGDEDHQCGGGGLQKDVMAGMTPTGQRDAAVATEKRHKGRKSALFKASKMFGGSQASLNKLKSFFMAGANKTSNVTATKQMPLQQQQLQPQQPMQPQQIVSPDIDIQHLESSRLRCMELNQAIKVPSIADALVVGEPLEPVANERGQHQDEAAATSTLEVGQGGGIGGSDKEANVCEPHGQQLQQQQPVLVTGS